MNLTLGEIAYIVRGEMKNISPHTSVSGIVTDSRIASKGVLFIAIKGENFDGVEFVDDAMRKGAVASIVTAKYEGNQPVIKVKDTIEALQSLASYHRKLLKNTTVIAITGSVGKTTTKELIAHILNSRYRVKRAIKSFNNRIGVPLTILDTPEDTEILVSEVGTNHPGEIRPLAELLKPHIAILTKVGKAHIAFFESLKEIAEEKSELFKVLESGGKAILNSESPYVEIFESSIENEIVKITYGIEKGDIHPDLYKIDENGTEFSISGKRFFYPIPGKGALTNALAALTVSKNLGIDHEEIDSSFRSFKGVPMRMEKIDIGKFTIINDAYNSNPDSLIELLETFRWNSMKKKIFVLGDMLELGADSEKLHSEAGKIFAEMGHKYLITVGELGKIIGEGAKKHGVKEVYSFKSNEEAASFLRKYVKDGDIVLLKASRKIELEKIIEMLREDS